MDFEEGHPIAPSMGRLPYWENCQKRFSFSGFTTTKDDGIPIEDVEYEKLELFKEGELELIMESARKSALQSP